jgi:NitT/TauT family transport system substrate-binding protein
MKKHPSILSRRKVVAGALSMLCLWATAACGAGSEEAQDKDGRATVRFATVPIAGVAAPFVADQAGVFKEESLALDPEFLRFTPDIVAAVVGRSADFGIVNTVTLLQSAAKGVPLKIVAPGYFSNAAEQGLYVKAGSDITSIEDLVGKRIAVIGLKNIQQLGLMALAEQAGVDPGSLEFVETPMPSMAAALTSGKIDAAALAEPFVSLAGSSLTEVIDEIYEPLGADGEDPIIGYFFTSEQFASKNADVVARLRSALLRGHELALSDPGRAREAIGTYTEVPPQTLQTMGLPGFGTSFAKPSLIRSAELSKQFDFIEDTPNLESLFVK